MNRFKKLFGRASEFSFAESARPIVLVVVLMLIGGMMSVAANAEKKTDSRERALMLQPPYDEAQLQEKLSPLEFKVTRHDGTERAFDNRYWDEKRDGIYVDLISGKPLFSSRDKYESGTGWPSFTKPIDEESVTTKVDRKFFMTRTEVRSASSDSHLGHVFPDGPAPTGKRYCMNSAAMVFIPKEKMKELGYEEYLALLVTE